MVAQSAKNRPIWSHCYLERKCLVGTAWAVCTFCKTAKLCCRFFCQNGPKAYSLSRCNCDLYLVNPHPSHWRPQTTAWGPPKDSLSGEHCKTSKTIEAVYKRAITKFVWQLGRYQPSPPSTKELHGLSTTIESNPLVRYLERPVSLLKSGPSEQIK